MGFKLDGESPDFAGSTQQINQFDLGDGAMLLEMQEDIADAFILEVILPIPDRIDDWRIGDGSCLVGWESGSGTGNLEVLDGADGCDLLQGVRMECLDPQPLVVRAFHVKQDFHPFAIEIQRNELIFDDRVACFFDENLDVFTIGDSETDVNGGGVKEIKDALGIGGGLNPEPEAVAIGGFGEDFGFQDVLTGDDVGLIAMGDAEDGNDSFLQAIAAMDKGGTGITRGKDRCIVAK